MKNRFFVITLAILTMGLFITSNLRAEEGTEPQPEPQPEVQPQAPTSVGRISAVHGNVSIMHGDSGQWAAAIANTPVVPADSVATADQSRTEVQLDYANIMRLDQRTEAKVADLQPNKIDIQLASGLIVYSANQGTQADAEIDTPNMGVHPLAPGVYRVQVNSANDTLLIVLQGEAEVLTNQGSTKVEAGQIIQIHGADNPEYKIDPAPVQDEFDRWCAERDQQMQNAQSWQHTNQYYTGASDLDTYGQWEQVPDYGWCWTPAVDAGWVPYSAGYWGNEPYWGWTWISYEPWGWAPYHYGRWFSYGGRWAWWPGVGFCGPRPIWAPAYVSFFGFGRGGFGFGLGFGSIGWLALGPRDIFHPWFGAGHSFGAMAFSDVHGAGFVRQGGPRFGSNLENMMTDAHIRDAVRNVSAGDFASGRMGHSTAVSESMMRDSSMMRGSLPVTPNRPSFGNRTGSVSGFHSGASNEHFFSRSSATATPRAGGNAESFGARSNATATGRVGAGQPGGASSSYDWQRYSSGSQSQRWPAAVNGPSMGSQERSAPTTQGNRYNWERFASPSPYSSGRSSYGESTQRGGWQGYSNPGGSYSGGAMNRSEGSYNGGGSRQPLNLNRPIMRQRAPSGGYYGGGGRSSAAPSGGGRSYSAPSGGHSSSAPHYSGGGGGRSSGGGHGGGRR